MKIRHLRVKYSLKIQEKMKGIRKIRQRPKGVVT